MSNTTHINFNPTQTAKILWLRYLFALLIWSPILAWLLDYNKPIIFINLGITTVAFVFDTFWILRQKWFCTFSDENLLINATAQLKRPAKNVQIAWHDIASVEIRKTRFWRLNYLHIFPKNGLPEIKLALFCLSPEDQNETVKIIQNRIQAA